jgi:hypothetical protein
VRIASAAAEHEVRVRSTDLTADRVHVYAGLPAATQESEILAMAAAGKGRCDRIDHALFKMVLRDLPTGDNTLTIVTFEPSGTHSVQRISAVVP